MALLARASRNTLSISNECFYKCPLNRTKLKFHKRFLHNLPPDKNPLVNTKATKQAPAYQHDKRKKYLVYDQAVSARRDQALRSILVQVQSDQSGYELYDYCSRYGKVQEMHHYTVNGSVHFIIVEFKSMPDVESINSVTVHTNLQQYLPVISPMLWFKATHDSNRKQSFSRDIPMTVTNGKVFPGSHMINEWLYKAESVSEQMTILCDSTKLNDTDTRVRFLTARQIEACLSGMFSNISVLPFGSSVNGFGKHGCDLDLVLKLYDERKENTNGRLVYHTKAGSSGDRVQVQKVMGTIADMMQQFLPGVSSIRKILMARVPIIKYNHTLTDLECDLSMTNTIGIYMSELLYLYGELDWRVRPLTFTIRMWASSVQLTNSSPGNWITNFSLTLLVLFFLQQKEILPCVQQLVKLASKDDVRIADGSVDCTFLRDISRLPEPKVRNEDSLEELLANFFIYYSNFDFSTKALSLNVGFPVPKPEQSSVFIYNPLEQNLNVTKNMNIQETERLKVEMRNAAWLLDYGTEPKSVEWGLLSLFQQKVKQSEPPRHNQGGRMLELSTLFKNEVTASGASLDARNATDNKNKSFSTDKNVPRPAAHTAKLRFNRKQEWRR